MRTSFKVHAALAAGMGGLMLLAAGLTLLPGALPLPSERLLGTLALGSLFPLMAWAFVRGISGGFDRDTQWPAFRCLPGWTQLALAVLLGAGVVLCWVTGASSGSRQGAEVHDGRYVAYETSPGRRGTVEIDRREYEAVREADQRGALVVPGTLLAGAALIVLVTGEVRRAETVTPVSTTSAAPASGGTRS